jgi:hypothetical protein
MILYVDLNQQASSKEGQKQQVEVPEIRVIASGMDQQDASTSRLPDEEIDRLFEEALVCFFGCFLSRGI